MLRTKPFTLAIWLITALITTGRGIKPMILDNKCPGWLAALFVFLTILPPAMVQADILDGWHWRNPTPFPDTMHSVCFGAGKFVAVGDGGVVHTSDDGTAWDAGQRPVVFTLNKVIYGKAMFGAEITLTIHCMNYNFKFS